MDQREVSDLERFRSAFVDAVTELSDPGISWSDADPTVALIRALALIARRHPERTGPDTQRLSRQLDRSDPHVRPNASPAPVRRVALAL